MKKSLRNELIFLLIFLILSFVGIWGNNRPVIPGLEKIAIYYNIVNNICLSYIASLIFYLLVEYIPKYNNYHKTKDYVGTSCNRILASILSVIESSIAKQIGQLDIRYNTITEKEIENKLNKVYMNTLLPDRLSSIDYNSNMSVKEAICIGFENTTKTINDLLRYLLYLDVDLVNIINSIMNNNLYESIKNSIDDDTVVKINGICYKIKESNLSGYSDSIYKLYLCYKELQKYYWDNFKDSMTAKIDIMMKTFHKDNNIKKTLHISEDILKIDEKNLIALLYKSMSIIELNGFSRAADSLNDIILKFPNLKNQLIQYYGEEKINTLLKK